MSVRITGAVFIVAALASCAKSSDEPPAVSANVMASQGYDAYNRGDYRDAVTYFEDALKIAPDNAFAMQGLAASLDSVHYFGEHRPLQRNSEVERTIYRLSLSGYEAYKRGDLAEADAQFRAVLDIAPDNRYARKGMEAVSHKVAQQEFADGIFVATATTYSDVTEARTSAADSSPVLSYDAPVAQVHDAPVVETSVVEAYGAPVTEASDDSAYVSVGSYDTYVISTGAIDPVYLGN